MLSKAAYRHLSRMTSMAELASFLKANAPKTRKSVKLARGRKQEKDAAHRVRTSPIYRAVLARAERAGGYCECGCGRELDSLLFARSPEMDHWLGGNGRRRQKQSVETCWMLTQMCHGNRGYHVPSVGAWNERFMAHCKKYGYPFEPHIEHAPLPEKQAVR